MFYFVCLEYHLEVFLPLNDHKNNTKRGTISWACNVDGTPFVGAGGINKVIPVVEVGNEKIHKVWYYNEVIIKVLGISISKKQFLNLMPRSCWRLSNCSNNTPNNILIS